MQINEVCTGGGSIAFAWAQPLNCVYAYPGAAQGLIPPFGGFLRALAASFTDVGRLKTDSHLSCFGRIMELRVVEF